MAIRREIVTLEEAERERFKAAVDGRAMENVLRRLRLVLKSGLDKVEVLSQEGTEVTREDLHAARSALTARLELLRQIPAVNDEVVAPAAEALQAGIQECDRIETAEFTSTSSAAGPPAATTGLSVVRNGSSSKQAAYQQDTTA
jgi:hypothetical protein